MQNLNKFNLKVVLSFAAVYIIWGTTYLAIKIGLVDMPPFLMATGRYVIAGTLLLLYALYKKQQLFQKGFVQNMLLGFFMLTLGQGVLFWAELHIASGLAAVLNATLPVWYIVIDRRNWKVNLKNTMTIAGIVIGLAGIILLFKDQAGSGTGDNGYINLIAAAVVILSCVCWAAGSLFYKHHHADGLMFTDVGWQLFGGAISCIIISLGRGELNGFALSQVSLQTWGALLYLAVAGSVIALCALYFLLSVRPASVVGTYAYVNPVVAVLLGFLVAKEAVSVLQICAIGVILASAYLVNRSQVVKKVASKMDV